MILLILRCLFLLVTSGIGVVIVRSGGIAGGNAEINLTTFFALMIFAVTLIVIDMAFPKKQVQWIGAIYFGLLIGMVMTYFMGMALEPFFNEGINEGPSDLRRNVMAIMLLSFSYLGVSFLLQTRNDFRFIIPYVEFQKNVKGIKPLILDTSVVIDGRIADVMETKLVDSPLVMPRFAMIELQRIAD